MTKKITLLAACAAAGCFAVLAVAPSQAASANDPGAQTVSPSPNSTFTTQPGTLSDKLGASNDDPAEGSGPKDREARPVYRIDGRHPAPWQPRRPARRAAEVMRSRRGRAVRGIRMMTAGGGVSAMSTVKDLTG
jgi:hypothetical protein